MPIDKFFFVRDVQAAGHRLVMRSVPARPSRMSTQEIPVINKVNGKQDFAAQAESQKSNNT
jgi:hypothetical protein